MKKIVRKIRTTQIGARIFDLLLWLYQLIRGDFSYFSALKTYLFNDWITNLPFHFVRITYLKKALCVKISSDTFVHMGCRFEGKISIGKNSVIGRNCILKGDITIGDNVSITAETYVFTSSHFVNSSDFSCFYKPVTICDYAWIGARAVILPGVTIGKGAVLGTASIATKDISDFSICVGSPAKPIGTRSTDLTYKLDYFPFFQ